MFSLAFAIRLESKFAEALASRYLRVQSQQQKYLKHVWNLFNANNKDTKTMSLTSFWFLLPLNWFHICDALRDLEPFVHFKKREKNPWRSATFSKVVGFCSGVSIVDF